MQHSPLYEVNNGPFISADEVLGHLPSIGVKQTSLKNTEKDSLLRGWCKSLSFRNGLSLHLSDTEDLQDMVTETEVSPCLQLKIFIKGSVDASLGGIAIPTASCHEKGRHWIPSATIVSRVESDRFLRRSVCGSHVRKVSITLKPEWFETLPWASCEDLSEVLNFSHSHLAMRSWTPSRKAVSLCEQMLQPSDFTSSLQAIHMESCVLGLLVEAFQQIGSIRTCDNLGKLKPQERRRLQIVNDYLDHFLEDGLSVAALAREAGTSINCLQRLFQQAYGTSVFSYVRQRKLTQAKLSLENDGVSISQAAYIAGYRSPANFSTAFKRAYSKTPRDFRKQFWS